MGKVPYLHYCCVCADGVTWGSFGEDVDFKDGVWSGRWYCGRHWRERQPPPTDKPGQRTPWPNQRQGKLL